MLGLYKTVLNHSETRLQAFLNKRLERGKEDAARIGERQGIATKPRPEGRLLWVHGASVGEAQSALILIRKILDHGRGKNLHVMITTGTKSSAGFLEGRLPEGCFHQFYPLDHPAWVARFLDHWKPDGVVWMESELWPNMLMDMKERGIPAAMVNARLSDKSYKRWRWIRSDARKILGCFDLVLTQNDEAAQRYEALGARKVVCTGNVKYSAKSLDCDKGDLEAMRVATSGRPLWVYASTHKGEEEIACQVHGILKKSFDDLLTIIIPRHPERGDDIEAVIQNYNLTYSRRSKGQITPQQEDDIYLADTMGELGLFYRLAPVACIGRSLSDDGGGGHNPVEAAQLHCGVLHGPRVQYQLDFFADMDDAGAAIQVNGSQQLAQQLQRLLNDSDALQDFRDRAYKFTQNKGGIAEAIMENLSPLLTKVLQP